MYLPIDPPQPVQMFYKDNFAHYNFVKREALDPELPKKKHTKKYAVMQYKVIK